MPTMLPAYPFGHGLSYTQFIYSRFRVVSSSGSTSNFSAEDILTFHFQLENVGKYAGSDVPQVRFVSFTLCKSPSYFLLSSDIPSWPHFGDLSARKAACGIRSGLSLSWRIKGGHPRPRSISISSHSESYLGIRSRARQLHFCTAA